MGEECERESSFQRGTPPVLEIERGVLGGWLLCWYVSVTVSMGVSYTLRSAWIDVIFCATVGQLPVGSLALIWVIARAVGFAGLILVRRLPLSQRMKRGY